VAGAGLPAHFKAEAAAWLARLHSDERTARDEAGFRLWLAADPRNRDAFGLVTGAWDEAGGAAGGPPVRVRRWTRRRVLGAGAAAAILAGGAGFWAHAGWEDYRTGHGELRRIPLADGSVLLLDSGSAVRVEMAADRRRVMVDRGRAHFRTANDSRNLFFVRAEGRDLIAGAASFDVAAEGGRLSLFVLAGSVGIRLGRDGLPGSMRWVRARERARIDPGGALRIDSPAPAPLVAWHDGEAFFAATRLRGAVAEMNRYARHPILIADPDLAVRPVSGRFDLGDGPAFARSVARQLSVPVHVQGGSIVIGRA